MAPRPTAHGAVTVDLPSFQSDDDPPPRAYGRPIRGGFSGHRGTPDDLGNERRQPPHTNVTVLSSRNPFGEEPPRHRGDHGERASRQPTSGGYRASRPSYPSYDDGGVSAGEEPGVTVLASRNPFGSSDPSSKRPANGTRVTPGGVSDGGGRRPLRNGGVSDHEEAGMTVLGSHNPYSSGPDHPAGHPARPSGPGATRRVLQRNQEEDGVVSNDEQLGVTLLGDENPFGGISDVPPARTDVRPNDRTSGPYMNGGGASGNEDLAKPTRKQSTRPNDTGAKRVPQPPADGQDPRGLTEEPADAKANADRRSGNPIRAERLPAPVSRPMRPIVHRPAESDVESSMEEPSFAPSSYERMVIREVGGVQVARPSTMRPYTRPRTPSEGSTIVSDHETISRPPSRGSQGSYHQPPFPHESSRGGRRHHRPTAHHSRDGQPHHGRRHGHYHDRPRHHHDHPYHHYPYYFDEHYHRYHDEYLPPYWHPAFQWPGYGLPRFPHRPFTDESGRPIYANIPELSSLVDRLHAPYPALPIPPPELLADLQKDAEEKLPTSALEPPSPNPPDEWAKAVMKMLVDVKSILPALKSKEFSMDIAAIVLRKLANTTQVRFAERHDDKIINRVNVVPRGRLALNIMSAANPELDVDLVIPADFILRRWNLNPTDDNRPTTVAKALGLDPASIAQGEVDAGKLKWVLDAVWEQLSGAADGFIFPGGVKEADKYIPSWCTREEPGAINCLRLLVSGSQPKIYVNVFVKVAVSLYGQDMVVGVDQTSAQLGDTYQMIKVMRTPGIALSEPPLSQSDRTAIHILNWWLDAFHIELGKPPGTVTLGSLAIPILPGVNLPSGHFYLALLACQRLNPSDEMYISPTNPPTEFSLVRILGTMIKILTYIGSTSSPLSQGDRNVTSLSSCTIMDALDSQGGPEYTIGITFIKTFAPALQLLLKGLSTAAAASAPVPSGATVPNPPDSSSALASSTPPVQVPLSSSTDAPKPLGLRSFSAGLSSTGAVSVNASLATGTNSISGNVIVDTAQSSVEGKINTVTSESVAQATPANEGNTHQGQETDEPGALEPTPTSEPTATITNLPGQPSQGTSTTTAQTPSSGAGLRKATMTRKGTLKGTQVVGSPSKQGMFRSLSRSSNQ